MIKFIDKAEHLIDDIPVFPSIYFNRKGGIHIILSNETAEQVVLTINKDGTFTRPCLTSSRSAEYLGLQVDRSGRIIET